MKNFKDESFILQFLSPKVMRDLHFFSILDDEARSYLEVDAIHDSSGYKSIREVMAKQYNLGEKEPNIQVYDVDIRGSRRLTLRHYQHQGRPLDKNAKELLKHVHKLWQFDTELQSVHNDDIRQHFCCPEPCKKKK